MRVYVLHSNIAFRLRGKITPVIQPETMSNLHLSFSVTVQIILAFLSVFTYVNTHLHGQNIKMKSIFAKTSYKDICMITFVKQQQNLWLFSLNFIMVFILLIRTFLQAATGLCYINKQINFNKFVIQIYILCIYISKITINGMYHLYD